MGGKKPLRRPLWPPTRATASNYYPLGLDGAGGAAKPLLRAPKKPAPLHGRLPAFSGAVDAFERARKCFLEWRYFFSIILSEFLKNRVALQVPTPSAVRGILSSIYAKKTEFYWQVTQIEVLNPIRYMSFQRNELKSAVSAKPDMEKSILYTDEERTQRQTQVLKNVRYRIRARICPRPSYAGSLEQLYRQAMRRIRSGKTFMQPCLGLREFVCYFEESDGSRPPIDVNMDLGLMVYDVFDLHDEQVRKVTKPKISLYHAVMEHGVIRVPDYDSEDVLKGGTAAC